MNSQTPRTYADIKAFTRWATLEKGEPIAYPSQRCRLTGFETLDTAVKELFILKLVSSV